ncbi:hypothetical protein ANAPRD1_01106 [Anaplasma phagocytophilum]|nr:hypothetical protein ANAPRD1_01106 [Anaplasma phagocytophilum]
MSSPLFTAIADAIEKNLTLNYSKTHGVNTRKQDQQRLDSSFFAKRTILNCRKVYA